MLAKTRISTRIAAGFGVILVLLLGLAGASFNAISQFDRQFSTYATEADTAFAAAELRHDTRVAQFAVADFSAQPTPERAERLDESVAALGVHAQDLRTLARGPAETALADDVAMAVDGLVAVIGAYRDSALAADTDAAQVTELGIAHRRGIGALNAALEARDAGELAYDALRASEMFLVTRVRIDRFLDGWPAEEFDTANAPFESTLAALDRIGSGVLMADERTMLRAERAGILEFRSVAERARDSELGRRAAFADLEAALPPLTAAVDAVVAYALDARADIAESVVATLSATGLMLMIVSALTVALGVGIAVLIGRSVASSAHGMTRTIEGLAEGDLDTPVTGTEARTEIGAMARALEVLRVKGLEARQLEAEAEADRAAQAERAESERARQERVVSDITAGLDRLADGDLTTPIDSPPSDPFPEEYEALRTSYNASLERLGDLVARIADVAGAVHGGANEISSASSELSSRAEAQAATLEQSAAALNELNESVRSTAGRAGAAEEASRRNHGVAQQGRGVVREAVDAMLGIERSSEQITRIIGVIDDIAFQTNLLALNAGVEAARAGEAGRGFAVVASEVRGLAQRATESAREIKGLIQESATQVENGSALVRRTGESLEDILTQAAEVSELMGEIAAAASEQAAGLDEINTGVNQLDQVTQQNAAAAEQTTASAASLSQKAEELSDALAGFRAQAARSLPNVVPQAAPVLPRVAANSAWKGF